MSSSQSAARGAVRPRLSVVTIARNAAELLPATVESVRSIADQILIVDTGSTDETVEVGCRLGATVIHHAWADDFSKSRNEAAVHATGEWILWLDAGESLAPQSAAELRQFVDSKANANTAYMLLVVLPAEGNNICGEQIGQLRLVPNRPELRFVGRVCESLKPSVEAAGLAVEGLPWRILRTARDHDPQVKLAKARRNLKLVELEMRERGQRPELLIALAESLHNLGEQRAAAAAFRQAIGASPAGSSGQRAAYYGLLTALDADPAQSGARMAVCGEALEAFPRDAQLLCAMGGYLQAQERLDLAARAYRMAFDFGQVDPETWHVPNVDEIAAVCLSLTLQLTDNDVEALAVLERALERNGEALRARRQLIDLLVKHDRRQEALAQFDKLPADLPHREALRSAIRGACLATRQNWVPAAAYLQTAYAAGCRDPLCLRWLAVVLVSSGATSAAEPVVREWLAVEPRSVEAQHYLAAIEANLQPAPGEAERRTTSPTAPRQRTLRVDAPGALAGDGPASNLGLAPQSPDAAQPRAAGAFNPAGSP